MMQSDTELLLRAMAGELTPPEQAALSERLAREPELERTLARLRGVESLLRAERAMSFAPGFADRVARRLAAEPSPRLVLLPTLERQFVRLTAAAAMVLAALSAYNVLVARGARQSVVEAALGLPAVTLDAAYSFGPVAEGSP